MKARLVMLAIVALVACTPRTETSSPRSEESPVESSSDAPTAEEPTSAAADSEAASEPAAAATDVPVVEVPIVEAQWRPALAPLSTAPLDDAEQERARQCLETHPLGADVNAEELMAAAACLRGARQYGREVALYRLVLTRHPQAPQAMEATRLSGLRLEQIDHRSGALDMFAGYLQKYPRQDDARAIGMRAVCLARSLTNEQREEELLGQLDRYYGRKGFVRPSSQDMPTLCAEAPSE